MKPYLCPSLRSGWHFGHNNALVGRDVMRRLRDHAGPVGGPGARVVPAPVAIRAAGAEQALCAGGVRQRFGNDSERHLVEDPIC